MSRRNQSRLPPCSLSERIRHVQGGRLFPISKCHKSNGRAPVLMSFISALNVFRNLREKGAMSGFQRLASMPEWGFFCPVLNKALANESLEMSLPRMFHCNPLGKSFCQTAKSSRKGSGDSQPNACGRILLRGMPRYCPSLD